MKNGIGEGVENVLQSLNISVWHPFIQFMPRIKNVTDKEDKKLFQ